MAGPGPLDGVRVIALTHYLFGPACAQYLADMGASVVKIEEPRMGAWERSWAGGNTYVGGVSAFYLVTHRNVRSIGLNLKSEQGRQIALRLLDSADVLIENFTPGVMARLRLGFDEVHQLNPSLIYASGSGYGDRSPYRELPGQDLLIQAVSGLSSITGTSSMPPIPSGAPVVDQHAATLLALAIVAALHRRSRTGQGDLVEVSMINAALDLQQEPLAYYMNGGLVSRPASPLGSTFHDAPYGIYETKDGQMALSLSPLEDVSRALGDPDVLRPFLGGSGDPGRQDELYEALAGLLRFRSTDEITAVFRTAGVWCSPVNDYEALLRDPAVNALEPFVTIPLPGSAAVRLVGAPIRFLSGSANRPSPPPGLGQHTTEILGELGFNSAEIDAFREEGVI